MCEAQYHCRWFGSAREAYSELASDAGRGGDRRLAAVVGGGCALMLINEGARVQTRGLDVSGLTAMTPLMLISLVVAAAGFRTIKSAWSLEEKRPDLSQDEVEAHLDEVTARHIREMERLGLKKKPDGE
jgi:hypothetical protein